MLPAAGALPPEAFAEEISRRLPAFGLSLGREAVGRLAEFLAELDVGRRRTNLTGPLPSLELVAHALESILARKHLPEGASLLDIGTGGGFPGLPLAIARPDVAATLLEPRPLRTAFLRAVIQRIGIPNAEVLEGKLAAVSGRVFRAASSRAVGDLATMVGEGPFLEPGGLLLAWTTDPLRLERELRANFRLEACDTVPGSEKKVVAAFRKRDGKS
jgi:16S rRNA (guanine527-N7)-methyltransferase